MFTLIENYLEMTYQAFIKYRINNFVNNLQFTTNELFDFELKLTI